MLAGYPAGVARWVAFVPRAESSDACFVPGFDLHTLLLSGCSQGPCCSLPRLAQAVVFPREVVENTWTELPYGSGMADGRWQMRQGPCQFRLFIHRPTPVQAEWGRAGPSPPKSIESTQWHAPRQRCRRQLHQSVAVAPCLWCGTCPTSPASTLSPQRHGMVKLEQLPTARSPA